MNLDVTVGDGGRDSCCTGWQLRLCRMVEDNLVGVSPARAGKVVVG